MRMSKDQNALNECASPRSKGLFSCLIDGVAVYSFSLSELIRLCRCASVV